MGTKPSRFIPATETAAFLVLNGFDCRGVRPNGRGSCGFVFEDTPELQQALLQFTSGRSTVEPRMFLRTLNDLRDLARSEPELSSGDTIKASDALRAALARLLEPPEITLSEIR